MLSAVSIPSDPQVVQPGSSPHEWRGPSWTTRLLILGLAALAIGAIGLLGGLEEVPAPPPAQLPTIAVNESVDAGPWRAGVTNAAIVTELGDYKPNAKGNYLLAIAVRVEILNAFSSAYEINDLARLPEFTGLADPKPLAVALIRDGSQVVRLNPGMPDRVAYVFEVKADTPPPKQVVVEINGFTARRNSLNKQLEWLDPGPRARVTVPVDDKRDAS
jgi:hypothetical protein